MFKEYSFISVRGKRFHFPYQLRAGLSFHGSRSWAKLRDLDCLELLFTVKSVNIKKISLLATQLQQRSIRGISVCLSRGSGQGSTRELASSGKKRRTRAFYRVVWLVMRWVTFSISSTALFCIFVAGERDPQSPLHGPEPDWGLQSWDLALWKHPTNAGSGRLATTVVNEISSRRREPQQSSRTYLHPSLTVGTR